MLKTKILAPGKFAFLFIAAIFHSPSTIAGALCQGCHQAYGIMALKPKVSLGQDVDAWTRIDVSGAYRLSEEFEVYGRVENLADATYQQVSGYGTPGRSGIIGGRLRF